MVSGAAGRPMDAAEIGPVVQDRGRSLISRCSYLAKEQILDTAQLSLKALKWGMR